MINNVFGIALVACVFTLSGCNSGHDESKVVGQETLPELLEDVSGDISLALKPAQLDWVGQKIFQNECAAKFQCLVHWNESEAFPSLGIGHFIWYPKGVNERFVESFPALITYMKQRQLNIPTWLRVLEPFDAPWHDREAFLNVIDSPEMAELREFLAGTQGVQAEFIFRRAKESLAEIVKAAPEGQQDDVRRHLHSLSRTPGGVYAIMDYVNFKGEGLSSTERYNGQGWGLLQVLLAMAESVDLGTVPSSSRVSDKNTLDSFRQAAGRVLTRRAENAENPVEKDRWLSGWLKRIDTYREPASMVFNSTLDK